MSYSIFKADLLKDKQSIINFWKSNFPTWAEEKYDWFYQSNPNGPAVCWLIKDSTQNKVVGCTVIFPRKYLNKNKFLRAGITGDFGVDKNHRILGPAIKLQKSVIASCDEDDFYFLYGYPNRNSEPVQKRAGFQAVGSSIRLVKPLLLQRYVSGHVKSAFLSKIFSKVIDNALKFISRETYLLNNKKYQFSQLPVIDERFDALWRETSTDYTLIGERTSEFLNWRFINCPHRKYRIVALEEKNSKKILGYIIYYQKGNTINIADIFTVKSKKVLENLLSNFITFLRKEKVETIEISYFGNKQIIKVLKSFRFSERDYTRKIVLYINPKLSSVPGILDENNWYFTEADND